MKKKIILVAVAAGLIVITSVIAYFQQKEQLVLGTFTTPQLDISLESLTPTNDHKLLPGESKELEFKVKNIGSVTTYLKGRVKTVFTTSGLDSNMLQLLGIWRKDAQGQWQPVTYIHNVNEFYLVLYSFTYVLDSVCPHHVPAK